jgi:hypothetical protein
MPLTLEQMVNYADELDEQQADLLVYDANRMLQLVVEIKARPVGSGATTKAQEWLQKIGEQQPNVFALFITAAFMALRLPVQQHQQEPRMVALSSQALGEQARNRLRGQADYIIDATASLDLAIDTRRVPLLKLDTGGLQRVVESWLSSCLNAKEQDLAAQKAQAWLVDSGLHTALRYGKIRATVS